MSKVKSSELYFLVLHWLKSTPCQDAASSLERELEQLSLLPTLPTLNTQGKATYNALSNIFGHVPTSALAELIEECVHHQTDHGNGFPSTGVVSLLEATGSFSFIPSVRRQVVPSTVILPPASCKPSFLQLLYQREFSTAISTRKLVDNLSRFIYDQLHHIKTLRGHRKAVYCVALSGDGRYILTGADDGLIKIWERRLGLLLITCRGHNGEITDLKINSDETLFASSSNDTTCRVWRLEEGKLGEHVCELTGHGSPVTFLSFNPKLRCALLSVSLDGTCRLWEAERAIEVIRLKPVGRFGHFYNTQAFAKPLPMTQSVQNTVQFVPDRIETDCGLTCCWFSSTGEHFAVSSRSGKCFLWYWDISSFPASNPEQTWPDVSMFVELNGHQKDVPLLRFSHQGNGLFTNSSDGTLKLWRPLKNGKRISTLKANHWKEQWTFTLPDPLPCPIYNNRRRKLTPECNQIAWSCDDQYLLAAFSCSVIIVWNSTTGQEENILYGGHSDTAVHVLETHPTDRKLCFSAGYDGMLILWDIIAGHKLKALSSQDTHPGRWRWADPLQLIDGQFSRDGMSIIVSDVAGQIHLYSIEPPSEIIKKTPYDQFFLYDYDRVIIGDQGQPVDMESGEPQHIHRTRFSMVDIMGMPYDPEIQEILLETKDLDMLPSLGSPPRTPASLLEMPPTVSAALWLANELGLGQQATTTRVQSAQQRQVALMQETGGSEELTEYFSPIPEEDLPEVELEEDSDGSEYTPDEAEPETSPLATRRSERIQTRAIFVHTPIRARRIPTRQHPEIPDVEDSEELMDWPSEEEFMEIESEESEEIPPPVETPISVRVRRRRARRRRVISPTVVSQPRRSYRRRRRNRPVENPAEEVNLGREFRSYAWLSEARRPVGFYVPQVGDNVVYFARIHLSFCEENERMATMVDHHITEALRFAELCEVCEVHYEISELTELVTMARVQLRFLDEKQDYFSSKIELLIPPPLFGHEEFLIHYNVFLKSAQHLWGVGEKCQVFYCGDLVEWWQGEIINDSLDLIGEMESIWDCEGNYRRFMVKWEDDKGMDPEVFSPWELSWCADEGPSDSWSDLDEMEETTRRSLVRVLMEAAEKPESEHFRETLLPETSFPLPDLRDNRIYYNRVVPLPLSLTTIQQRLQYPTYYTNIKSFKQDVETIIGNAELFTGPESVVSRQARCLRDFIFEQIELPDESEPRIVNEVRRRRRARRPRLPPPPATSVSSSEPVRVSSTNSDYQIRTRGMAKRERQTENEPIPRSTRRRCTRFM